MKQLQLLLHLFLKRPVEELDICLQDRQFELITGCKKICIGGHSQLSKEEADWVVQSISAVLAEVSV